MATLVIILQNNLLTPFVNAVIAVSATGEDPCGYSPLASSLCFALQISISRSGDRIAAFAGVIEGRVIAANFDPGGPKDGNGRVNNQDEVFGIRVDRHVGSFNCITSQVDFGIEEVVLVAVWMDVLVERPKIYQRSSSQDTTHSGATDSYSIVQGGGDSAGPRTYKMPRPSPKRVGDLSLRFMAKSQRIKIGIRAGINPLQQHTLGFQLEAM